MIKKVYTILKYVHKNPNISKNELLSKFPNFGKYEHCISEYVCIDDNNVDIMSEVREKLIVEATALGLNSSEIAEYERTHMQNIQNVTDDNLIVYSTNLKFDEYMEKHKHDILLFWLPYSITTLIAIASLIAQILK